MSNDVRMNSGQLVFFFFQQLRGVALGSYRKKSRTISWKVSSCLSPNSVSCISSVSRDIRRLVERNQTNSIQHYFRFVSLRDHHADATLTNWRCRHWPFSPPRPTGCCLRYPPDSDRLCIWARGRLGREDPIRRLSTAASCQLHRGHWFCTRSIRGTAEMSPIPERWNKIKIQSSKNDESL